VKLNSRVLILKFDDEDYAGLEVKAKSVSLGVLLDLEDETSAMRKGSGIAQTRDLLSLFADKLISWNLEDDEDKPIPTSLEGVLSLEIDHAYPIILAWVDAMLSVGRNAGKGSTSGLPSVPAPDFPMEAL
jgi:hypothetical protein